MFCKHDWVVLDKTVVQSPAEFIEKYYYSEGPVKMPSWMFKKTIIIICKCNKCGKIKRYVTKVEYNN